MTEFRISDVVPGDDGVYAEYPWSRNLNIYQKVKRQRESGCIMLNPFRKVLVIVPGHFPV